MTEMIKKHLVPEWKLVLRYAYSVRLMILAAILSGIEIALPFMENILPVPTGAFAGMSFFVTVAAFISRFYAQDMGE